MREVETDLQSCPVTGVKSWIHTRLGDYQAQLEKFSKEVSFSPSLGQGTRKVELKIVA